ncbi:ribonuclease HII [Chitinolyticbacter albus]|uniref:ribonuclease HII n=1 Tax=Chitinolyticbacter albus TaxID=2961951 RepID=UPI002109BBDC|nr:ribonuclease HII [Chitinolyticbacter albus]
MIVCGVDEAGRGPLAGSVYAAAVILPDDHGIVGLNDSKKLSAAQREKLFVQIQLKASAWMIASASASEIDDINILQATLLAMQRAVEGLSVTPHKALVDGNRPPRLAMAVETIVKGDAKVQAISAASILAKVARDREADELEALYPGYGFAQHKGYPTAQHLAALAQLGPCAAHRRSFGPVRAAFAQHTLW